MLLNLKAEMARTGVKCSDIGQVADVSERTVRSWIRGESQPTVGQAMDINASLFPGLTVMYLFHGANRNE